jgi:hypothetical protein
MFAEMSTSTPSSAPTLTARELHKGLVNLGMNLKPLELQAVLSELTEPPATKSSAGRKSTRSSIPSVHFREFKRALEKYKRQIGGHERR